MATEPFDSPFPSAEYPPEGWFDPAQALDWITAWRAEHGADDGLRRLIVDDHGRVGGLFYEQGVCHVDHTATMTPGQHDCWQPPPSPSGYARFHQADAATADGRMVRVGAVGDVGGHASPFVSPSVASAHYADPGAQQFVCRVADVPGVGGVLAGALVPGRTFGDVARLRRSTLSGDWRWFAADAMNGGHEGYDCLGPTLVTRPGLPGVLQRFTPRAASAHPVYLGGCGGVMLDEPGGPTVKITMPDGSVLDVDDNATIETRPDGVIEVRTAAPPASSDTPPADGEGDTGGGDTVSREEFDALAGQVSEIVAWIQSQQDAEAAAVQASVAALAESAPTLPA